MVRQQVVHQRAAELMQLMHLFKKGLHTHMGMATAHFKDKLTMPQMMVLGMILDKGPQSIRGLSRLNQVAMPTMSEMINRLVKCGLVKREQDRRDRRVVLVALTSKGEKLFLAKMNTAQEGLVNLLTNIKEKDQIDLLNAFTVIERIINQNQKRKG